MTEAELLDSGVPTAKAPRAALVPRCDREASAT
jgi:hypothetical protein